MTSGETVFLAMAVAAFVAFALVLGWVSFTERRASKR